ncbi:YdgA family protein [Massilia sp. PAMC28688]|uniref:DUF945 family protein n=1 Tax=Massilia sp. PAMC28688 TaxID=2861283 RepID=UPI001C6282EE|nr:DUF945 family protein [Massilia sp. PAMC28688]QYF94361.1 YdgA family protein [Massilia sp. PAMC28688]
MKKSALSVGVALALFANSPAHAAPLTIETKRAEATAKQSPSPRVEAFTAALQELADVFGTGKGNPIPLLDKLVQHRHSEQTRAQLMQHFGIDSLFTVTPASAPAGKVAYAITTPANRHMDPNGEAVEWATLNAKIELDKAGRRMISSGSWPSFSVHGLKSSMRLSDITLTSDQTRSSRDVWLGKGGYRIGSIVFGNASGDGGVEIEDLTIDADVIERKQAVTIGFDMRIKAVKVAGEQVDHVRFASRMSNVDMKAFEALSKAIAAKEKQMDPALAFLSARPELIAFGKTMAARGTAIEIDEISAGYRGHQAKIKGRVSLAPMKDADFANAAAFVKKLVARMEVQVPLALVSEVAGTVTSKQAEAKGQPMADGAVAQASQGITDAMVGKVVTSGYGRVHNDMLVTVIEFKNGKLTLNNKEVAMPARKPTPAASK